MSKNKLEVRKKVNILKYASVKKCRNNATF